MPILVAHKHAQADNTAASEADITPEERHARLQRAADSLIRCRSRLVLPEVQPVKPAIDLTYQNRAEELQEIQNMLKQ